MIKNGRKLRELSGIPWNCFGSVERWNQFASLHTSYINSSKFTTFNGYYTEQSAVWSEIIPIWNQSRDFVIEREFESLAR